MTRASAIPVKRSDTDPGSGTVLVGTVVKDTSSSANDDPAGSPVMVTELIPPEKFNWISSFGWFPEDTEFAENKELAVTSNWFDDPYPSRVRWAA